MERLTGRDVRLGFVDSDTLPSYVAIYEKLQEYENMLEDKNIVVLKQIPQKAEIIDSNPISTNDFELRGFKRGWNTCIDQIVND